MDILILKISIVGAMVFMLITFSCKKTIPDLQEIYTATFSEAQIRQVRLDFENAIDTMMKYHLGDVAFMRRGEWEILEPICFNLKYDRALATVGDRGRGKLSNMVSIYKFLGFNYEGEWHFLRGESYPLLMEEPEGTIIDEYTFERINEIAIDKILRHSVKYNRKAGKWEIRDQFFKAFMDNDAWIGRENRLNEVDYRTLPDSFFVNVYLKIVELRNRKIEIIKEKWKREDRDRENGLIDDDEWENVLGMRNPKTDEDWKRVNNFNRTLKKDSIITNIMNELNK